MPFALLAPYLFALSGLIFPSSHSLNPESISSSFEIHRGLTLIGHTIDTCAGEDVKCALKCLRNENCQSYSCPTADSLPTRLCRMHNETRRSKPQDFKQTPSSTYFEIVKGSDSRTLCDNGGSWDLGQNQCICQQGYKGIRCQSKMTGFFPSMPGRSCRYILEAGDGRVDGEYWIDPENNANALKVYCDMTTDRGGWLLVANFVMDSSTPPPDWSAETAYRGISNYHNNRMGITKSAMNQLRTHLPFTQLRFHCRKQLGNTFHVTTVANNTGEAVVQYFSGQTDVLPSSCHSFVKMSDDNSRLAAQCDKWGNDGGHYVGKWAHYRKKGERRMYDHTAFVAFKNHWVIVGGNWLCDDNLSNNLSPGDFWKIFVL